MASSPGSTPQKVAPSIAPEKLLRASLLQMFYSIPSERQLMEQLDYNLLFRWLEAGRADDGARPGGGEPGAECAEIDELPGRRMFQGHPEASCVSDITPVRLN
jgi:hypothetical protein